MWCICGVSGERALQKRYVERAPGCHEPPPIPFQHRKGANRKSAPKPGTAEEARQQAQQAKTLARVGRLLILHAATQP